MSDADVSAVPAPVEPLADAEPAPDLPALETLLGHAFRDQALLRRAVTHASSTADKAHDNERLEFLGDSILALAICEHLFLACPTRREGDLTEIKSAVVSREALAVAARSMDLRRFLLLGRGIRHRKELPASVLANAFEAVVAALYLDAGYDAARRFVLKHLGGMIETVLHPHRRKNYKSLLQQEIQRSGDGAPDYVVIAESGPDHDKVFEVAVRIGEEEKGRGIGASKKEAEQAAARVALETLAAADAPPPPDAPP